MVQANCAKRSPTNSQSASLYSNDTKPEPKPLLTLVPLTSPTMRAVTLMGAPGLFITRFAPADYMETVNTPGLPRYMKQIVQRNGKGWIWKFSPIRSRFVQSPARCASLLFNLLMMIGPLTMRAFIRNMRLLCRKNLQSSSHSPWRHHPCICARRQRRLYRPATQAG